MNKLYLINRMYGLVPQYNFAVPVCVYYCVHVCVCVLCFIFIDYRKLRCVCNLSPCMSGLICSYLKVMDRCHILTFCLSWCS